MSAKHVYLIALVLALVALYVCWSGAPLIWDGSYQLSLMLIWDAPYSYLSRFHSAVVWHPTVWASHLTDNVRALTIVYGLPFCLAPVVGLLASWAIVRRQAPSLMLWATMGILAGSLPGQIFIINDSIFQLHLFWPVFLGMLVRLSGWQVLLLAAVGIFQFSHPIGIATFFGAAMAAGIMAWADPESRRAHLIKALVMVLCSALAAAKLGLWPDSYAAQEAQWHEVAWRWRKGVAGWPIRGLLFAWLAAGLLLAHRFAPRAWLARAAMACLALTAAMWIYWAADHMRWAGAIDYRRWILPLSMPFFACIMLERMAHASRFRGHIPTANAPAPRPGDPLAAWILTATFAIVLCLQGTQWLRLSDRLMADVHAHPDAIIPPALLKWTAGTPLDHWGLLSLVMIHQGKNPSKLLLDDRGIETVQADPPQVPVSPFTPVPPDPGPTGWFDFRDVVRDIRERR